MHLSTWDGSGLARIEQKDLPAFCRQGVYVCCKSEGHADACGHHLWIYAGPDPVPAHQRLMAAIHRDVPHVNGSGSHA